MSSSIGLLTSPFVVRRSLSMTEMKPTTTKLTPDKKSFSSMIRNRGMKKPSSHSKVSQHASVYEPVLYSIPFTQNENNRNVTTPLKKKSCLRESSPNAIMLPCSKRSSEETLISFTDEIASSNESLKRHISFSPKIENVCLFKIADSPIHISSMTRYSVPDNGDVEAKSISSVMDQPWHCIRMDFCRNSYPHFSYDDPPVFLENACLTLKPTTTSQFGSNFANSGGYFLTGSILVKDWAFEKYVGLRYSADNWTTWKEISVPFEATFKQGIDRFKFELDLNEEFKVNLMSSKSSTIQAQLSFAIKYCVSGQEFWDNNRSKNYNMYFEKEKQNPLWFQKALKQQHQTEIQDMDEIELQPLKGWDSLLNRLPRRTSTHPSLDSTKYNRKRLNVDQMITEPKNQVSHRKGYDSIAVKSFPKIIPSVLDCSKSPSRSISSNACLDGSCIKPSSSALLSKSPLSSAKKSTASHLYASMSTMTPFPPTLSPLIRNPFSLTQTRPYSDTFEAPLSANFGENSYSMTSYSGFSSSPENSPALRQFTGVC